jgi:hypothetical protein
MSSAARSLPLPVAATRPERARDADSAEMLSRREATLRSAATACLAGIALVQAIELPSLFVQGRQFAVLSLAAMAACVVLGLALAAAPEDAARLWRVVAAAAGLVLAGWAVPRVFALPGLATADAQDWTTMPGAPCAVLAVVCLLVAVAAIRPGRANLRGMAAALAVAVALAPGVGVLLVSLGPGTAGGETVLATGGHIHSQGSPENAIVWEPLPGGGGHYVYRTVAAPQQTGFGLGLLAAAALVFTYGAVGHLRRRSSPDGAVVGSGLA